MVPDDEPVLPELIFLILCTGYKTADEKTCDVLMQVRWREILLNIIFGLGLNSFSH